MLGITLESIAELKVDVPEGCFKRISELCLSNALNFTSCSNLTVTDILVDKIFSSFSVDLGLPVIVKDVDFSNSVTYNSICEDNQDTDWAETYEIKSSESREPNSTYDVAVVLLKQEFTVVSCLQVSINSFGTSSIQHACSFVNGDAFVKRPLMLFIELVVPYSIILIVQWMEGDMSDTSGIPVR
jgi:hypothetical protein